jgi:hypothetical protein
MFRRELMKSWLLAPFAALIPWHKEAMATPVIKSVSRVGPDGIEYGVHPGLKPGDVQIDYVVSRDPDRPETYCLRLTIDTFNCTRGFRVGIGDWPHPHGVAGVLVTQEGEFVLRPLPVQESSISYEEIAAKRQDIEARKIRQEF